MSIAIRCRHGFDRGDRQRGQSYYHQGRVEIVAQDPEGAVARVQGSYGEPYEVRLDWSRAAGSGVLALSCECPRFAEGYFCKHLWATLLTLDETGDPAPGTGPLKVELDPESDGGEWHEEEEDWDEEVAGAESLPPSLQRLARVHPRRLTADEPWRQQLDLVLQAQLFAAETGARSAAAWRRREVWYCFNVERSARHGELMIDIYQRRRTRSGKMGKATPLKLRDDILGQLPDGEDLRLLRILQSTSEALHQRFAYAYAPPHSGRLPRPLHTTVLPRLCATGRFLWAEGELRDLPEPPPLLSWQGEPPWRPVLRLESAGEDRPARLTGHLERDGEIRPLTEPELMIGGLMLLEDRVALADTGTHLPWVSVLRMDGRIEVPAEGVEELLETLTSFPSLPRLELPPELRPGHGEAEPRPYLVLRPAGGGSRTAKGKRDLQVEVTFDYGGARVAPDTPGTMILLHGTDRAAQGLRHRLLPRHREAERRALARLDELGCDLATLRLPRSAFVTAVEALLAEGWTVEAEGGKVRSAGGFTGLRLESGIDWFELSGEMDFEGSTLALPELLAAARRGENLVRLGDGSQGLLPARWLERYAPLAHLAPADGDTGDRGAADGRGVRFLPSQAALLDALLAAEEAVDVDATFERLRRRLRDFEGIEPRAEPPGFAGELRPYQRAGLGWLEFLREFGLGGCLADDMGLGKTVQVLALLQARRQEGKRRPALIVAPRSVAHNWLAEAARFTPDLTTLDYTGSERRQWLSATPAPDLMVTTYGTLRRDILKLKEMDFEYAVLDEAQAIKNAASQTAKACRLLRARHRLALTGTPVENHLGELWSIFEFLNPGMLGRLPALGALGGDGLSAGDATLAAVGRAMRPFILRRTKEQVLPDLPAKTEQTLFCDLGRKQRRLYDELRDHYRAALTERIETVGLGRAKIMVLEALLRLRQAACHPALLDGDRERETGAKLEVPLEQLREVAAEGHKALVFSQFTRFLALLRRRLEAEGLTYEYLDGRTRKRREKVERFQGDAACPFFLISLKAGGVGLNLTAAEYVFLLDPWWNPAVEAQAIDRAHRIGQTRPVFAYRLISRDTVEERILELQASKRRLADAILDPAGSNLMRRLTAEDLRQLLS